MRLFAIYHPVLREIPRKTGLFLCFHGFFRLFSFPGLFWTLHVFQHPALSEELQRHTYFEFGSIEDHYKYRDAVMQAYPHGNFPVFEGHDHMQYQIRDPKGFAEMLCFIAEHDRMPELEFIQK